MLKTKTRIFFTEDDSFPKKEPQTALIAIDLSTVIGYYQVLPDDDYPEECTNIYFGKHQATILMTYSQFELIFEAFKKEEMMKNVMFKN